MGIPFTNFSKYVPLVYQEINIDQSHDRYKI